LEERLKIQGNFNADQLEVQDFDEEQRTFKQRKINDAWGIEQDIEGLDQQNGVQKMSSTMQNFAPKHVQNFETLKLLSS
jgi:hypothetical protein